MPAVETVIDDVVSAVLQAKVPAAAVLSVLVLSQLSTTVTVGAVGIALIVTVLVAVAFGHPPEPNTVYVIVAVPAETPEITPVEAFTLAIPELSDVQVPPAVPLLVKVVVAPTHAVCVPLKTPALTPGSTVTKT